jgi:hypothetical protein
MLFGYESPGMNALHWFQHKTVDTLIQNTFEPKFLEFFDHVNGFFQIPWTMMLSQVMLIAAIGVCGYVAVTSMGEKPIGNMIVLVTVVSCIDAIIRCVLR